jgi:ATP-dependent Clp protease, protease subunit
MCMCEPEQKEKKDLNSLEKLGIFLLLGIDDEVYKDFTEKIIKWNQYWEDYDAVHMIINSPGGSLNATFGIVSFMDWSCIPVHTFANGICASGGFIIMMAGEKGERRCTPTTEFLSHNFSGGRWGNYPQLVSSRKSEDMAYEMVVRHYSQHTNLKTEKDIRKYLLRDTDIFLTPEECLDYGVIDEITKDKKDIPKVIYTGYGDKPKKKKDKKKK